MCFTFQFTIFIQRSYDLGKFGTHGFIDDHIGYAVLPAGNITIDITIGGDDGMISFCDAPG
jgi:hypothetical protein